MPDILLSVGLQTAHADTTAFKKELESMINSLNRDDSTNVKLKPVLDTAGLKKFKDEIVSALSEVKGSASGVQQALEPIANAFRTQGSALNAMGKEGSASLGQLLEKLNQINSVIEQINGKNFNINIGLSNKESRVEQLSLLKNQLIDTVNAINSAQRLLSDTYRDNDLRRQMESLSGINFSTVLGQLFQYNDIVSKLQSNIKGAGSFAELQAIADNMSKITAVMAPLISAMNSLKPGSFDMGRFALPDFSKAKEAADSTSQLKNVLQELGVISKEASKAGEESAKALGEENKEMSSMGKSIEDHVQNYGAAVEVEKQKKSASEALAGALEKESAAADKASEAAQKDAGGKASSKSQEYADAAKAIKEYYEIFTRFGKDSAAQTAITLGENGFTANVAGYEELAAALNRAKTAYDLVTDSAAKQSMSEEEQAKLNELLAESQKKYALAMEDAANKRAAAEEKARSAAEESSKAAESKEFEKQIEQFDKIQSQVIKFRATFSEIQARINNLKVGDALSDSFKRLSEAFNVLNSPTATPTEKIAAYEKWAKALDEVKTGLSAAEKEEKKLAKDAAIEKKYTALKAAIESMRSNPKSSGIRDELNSISTELDTLKGQYESGKISQDEFNTGVDGLSARANNARASLNGLGNSVGMLTSRFEHMLSLSGLIMLAFREIKQMIKTATELDTAMTQLKIVTNGSNSDYAKFGDAISATAKQIGASTKDLIDSTTVFARLGYTLEDSGALAKYTAMLSNVGDIDVSSAQSALTAITKAYDISADQIETIMDKMVAVGNNFPISVSEIAEGMNNAGSALSAAGNSFEQSIALLTAANTTVQNISKSSTGLRTITARIRKTKLELDDLGESIETAKYQEAIDILTKHRVALTENGEFRATYDILKDIAAVWKDLTSMEQANIAEQLAGNRQQNVFFSIVEQFQEASNAMDAMNASAGTLATSYGKYMNSIEAHVNKFKATFQELSTKAVDSFLAKGLIDTGSKLLELLSGILSALDGIGGVLPVITATIGVLTTLSFPNIAQSFMSIGSVLKAMGTMFAGGGITVAGLSGVLGVLSAIATIITVIIAKTKQAKEEARQAAMQAAQELASVRRERDATVESSIQRIQEIKEKIAQGGLSTTELANAQQELLNIRSGLVDALGDEAASIDILGDSAESTAAKIRGMNDELRVQDASNYVTTYRNQFEEAKKQIEGYSSSIWLGQSYKAYDPTGEATEFFRQAFYDRIAEILSGYNNLDLKMVEGYNDGETTRDYTLEIDVDAYTAKEELNGLYKDLERLKSEFKNSPNDLLAVNNLQKAISSEASAIDSITNDYGDIYNSFIENSVIADDKMREVYKAIKDAESEYHAAVDGNFKTEEDRAVAMGKALEKILSAGKLFDGLDLVGKEDEKEFLSKMIARLQKESEGQKLKLRFNVGIENETRLRKDLTEAFSAFAGENGAFTKSDIEVVGQLIESGGDLATVTDEQRAAYEALTQMMRVYGVTLDDIIAAAVEYGIASTDAADSTEIQTTGLITLQKELENTTAEINKYKQALEVPEKGDLAEQYKSAYKKFEEDMEAGRTDSNAIRAAVELFLPPEKLQELGYDLEKTAAELSKPMYKALFTGDGTAGENFANYLLDTFGAAVEGVYSAIDNGNGTFDIMFEDFDKLADLLGIDKELFAALRDSLDLFGTQAMISKAEVAGLAESIGLVGESAPTDNLDRVRQAIAGISKEYETIDPFKINAILNSLAQAGYIDLSNLNLEDIGNEIAEFLKSVETAGEKETDIHLTSNAPEIKTELDKLNEYGFDEKVIPIVVDKSGLGKFVNVRQAAASGTSDASGGKTLVNELGPELIAEDGKAYIAGGGKPTIVNLKPGAIVLDAEETKRAMRGGTIRNVPIRSAAFSYIPTDAYKKQNAIKEAGDKAGKAIQDFAKELSSATVKYKEQGGSPGGGGGGGGGGGSSGNKNGDNWFKEQYEEHKHLVEMDKETEKDFLDWLDEAYKRAYDEQIIDLKEYRQHEEEVYKGRQNDFKDYLSDIEHLISIEQNGKNDPTAIYNYYVQMMTDVEKELEKAYAAGLDSTNEYVQYLQNAWYKYQQAIQKQQDDAEKAAEKQVKDLVNYRIKMLKQELKNEIQVLKDRLSNLKDFYSKQKEMLQDERDEEKYIDEQAEKRKAVSDIQAELAQLENDNSAWAQKRKKKLQEELAKAQKTLDDFEKDHALKVAQDQLDAVYEAQEKDINSQVDAIQSLLDDPKYLYERALADVQNNSIALYEEMIAYNDKYGTGIKQDIVDMWEEAYISLKKYYELYGEYYKDINLINATGYVDPSSGVVPMPGGYASGTSHATKGLHRIDELGAEYVFTSKNGNRYRMLGSGDKVLDADSTNFLYRFATAGRTILSQLLNGGGIGGLGLVGAGGGVTEIRMGDIIINGNADDRTVSEIRRAQREGINTILKEFNRLKK